MAISEVYRPTEVRAAPEESLASGVSWAAVFAGTFVIAALSLILLSLGSGLGLSSISPWSGSGVTTSTFGTAAILWFIVMQVVASAMGGYLAGRLRTRWTRIHNDEVFFRDTAHGFLSWALAAVVTATFLVSAAATLAGGYNRAASGPSGTSASVEERMLIPTDYYVDRLFRSGRPLPEATDPIVRAEASRILFNELIHKDPSGGDRTYLTQLVAARTGMSPSDADKRASDVLSESQVALDSARKMAAHVSLWTFIAMLIGAFCASYAATIGGRQRDSVVVT